MRLVLTHRITARHVALCVLGLLPGVELGAAEPPPGLPSLEVLLASAPVTVRVPAAHEARLRSVLLAVKDPGVMESAGALTATISPARAAAQAARDWHLSKTLHVGDPDVVWTIRQPQDTELRITVALASHGNLARSVRPICVAVRVVEVGAPEDRAQDRGTAPSRPDSERVAFEAEPNDTPETANPLNLGETVYGLADDRPYLPVDAAQRAPALPAGADWFRFSFEEETAKLAFFALDFVDRDVPPDVRIYREEHGKLAEYTAGIDPQSAQRERPPRPGANKFTTRVLTRGKYYVWVDACQPEYQLRTKLFGVPPYLKPESAEKAEPAALAAAARKAIRTAMDFQLLAGDSWHANTPRRGHPLDRVGNFHHETSTCVACHPTQFTTQSVLAGVKAGYEIAQPFALQFLLERLANNPVPLAGHPDAVWARMIPAPANVLGRLSTIVMDYENHIAGSPRDNLHRSIAEFLKLYYDGRSELPPDETNGNNPVSRYKVASDSWRQLDEIQRRTGDPRYALTRDVVARLLATGQPKNTRDLAAQTIGLCLLDPPNQRPASLIDANAARLLVLQRPSGHWSVKFDQGYPITEMQTGESLYALAQAGLRPGHAALRRGAIALLGRQQPFGGWFDINPYEQFRTPYRETQWALIALATLYPATNPRARGWNNPLGRQPARLRCDSPATLIRDLERIWDEPDPALVHEMTAALDHELPLVRYAACRALGRGTDLASVAPLAKALADPSKVVRRAAAEALRSIGNRANAACPAGQTPLQKRLVSELARALLSADARTRRGATRIFAAHFRELSQETALLAPLLEAIDDSDPVVAMQAIKGAWRYWYWRSDPILRNHVEDRLLDALARPRHPWVRRNLIEALYIIGDENIRYLYQNWVPALASPDARRRVSEDQHATVNRLGEKFAAALARGNPLLREGVLRAMSEFFERPSLNGRIGNDLEPMLFYGETARTVATALVRASRDSDATIRRLALQALVTVRGDRSREVAAAVMRRLGDADESVRRRSAAMAKEFPLDVKPGAADAATVALVDELLAQPAAAAQAAALDTLARIGPLTIAMANFDPAERVRSRVAARDPSVGRAALEALGSFPALWAETAVRAAVAHALRDTDPLLQVAAIRHALEPKAGIPPARLRKALDDAGAEARLALLDRIASEPRLTEDLRLVGILCSGLAAGHAGVREKALGLLQTHPALLANGAVEHALRELSHSGSATERQGEIARTLLATRGRASALGAARTGLDLAYFEQKVLPILSRLGEDGQNCVGCHRAHTILRLRAPAKDGQWTQEAIQANYRAALRVVNLARPAKSLLVNKPTWEAAEEAEAQNDPSRKAHTGGVRFERGSREYQTLLDWINGARLVDRESRAAVRSGPGAPPHAN
jgi:HEAT repeat protein